MAFTGKDWRNATTHEGGGDESTPISAAAIEDLETRLSDYTDLRVPHLDITDYGAVGDGATDCTAAIQAALDDVPGTGGADDAGGIVYIPAAATFYKLTDTLTIPDIRGLRIIGESMDGSELRMTVNNTPILETSGQYQEALSFEEFRLSYSTQQTEAAHPNSHAIYINGPNLSSCYYSKFSRLRIKRATNGIFVHDVTNIINVWNCTFADIAGAEISRSLIDLTPKQPTGQPTNYFTRITYIDETAVTQTGYALDLFGEGVLNSIDIEDWSYAIMRLSGDFQVYGLHLERIEVSTDLLSYITVTGMALIEGVLFDTTMPNGFTCQLVQPTTGSTVRVRNVRGAITGTGTLYYVRGADDYSRIEASDAYLTSGSFGGGTIYPNLASRQASRITGGSTGGVATLASAGTVTLPIAGEVFSISGTANVSTLTPSWAERRVTLHFPSGAGGAGLQDSVDNLILASDFGYTQNDTITMVSDGTYWYETGRSVN